MAATKLRAALGKMFSLRGQGGIAALGKQPRRLGDVPPAGCVRGCGRARAGRVFYYPHDEEDDTRDTAGACARL